jgi:hypothetical protein
MIRNAMLTCVLAAAGALSPLAPMPAHASDRVVGGPGGAPFRIKCDGFIVGFEGRSGAWIDHLTIVCGTLDPDKKRFSKTGAVSAGVGAGKGGPTAASCPSGFAVTAIRFQNTWREGRTDRNDGWVKFIEFTCAPPDRSQSVRRTFGPPGEVEPPCPSCFGPIGAPLINLTHRDSCSKEFAVGLNGRSGSAIDALGLICEPLPAAAPAPSAATLAPTQATPVGPATCKSGFVWRVAGPNDFVCVTPDSRARAASENRTAAGGVQPGGGASGPNTCRSGLVWRSAFDGDFVCVPPAIRAFVQEENRVGHTRVAGSSAPAAGIPMPTASAASTIAQPATAAPAAAGSFSGTWISQTNRNSTFVISLVQNGREVSGTYVTQNGEQGRIVGRFGANVMQFNWEQAGGFSGSGQFTLSSDGNSFTGSYRAKPHPKIPDPSFLQGAWNGKRQ